MKKILFLLLIIPLVFACEDPKEVEPFKLDTDATIRLIPASSTKSTRSATLTDLEIVQQANKVSFIWDGRVAGSVYDRGFSDAQRNTTATPPYLSMFPSDVVNTETGNLELIFIESYDVVLCTVVNEVVDTIAYIPNATIRKAEADIKAAYTGENASVIYEIFTNAYQFIPISGEEWRTLKSENKQ